MNSRQIKLLKILCANKDYEAVNQIAERLNISRRTVFNDLKIVEQFLITNQIPLLKKQGKGIKVTINYKDTCRIQELIDYEATSFEITEVESRFLENIETLLKGKKVTYESLAATYYISNSSVAQLFEKIKLFFSDKAGCTFYSGSQGSYVTGSESQLQFSYTKLIFERSKNTSESYVSSDNHIQFLKQSFGERAVNSCMDMLNDVLELNISQFNVIYYRELLTKLVVMIHRIQQEHHVEDTFMNSTLVLQLESYAAMKEYLNLVGEKLSIIFTEADIFYMNHLFIGYGINVSDNKQVYQKQVKEIVQQLIVRMSDVSSIDFSQDDVLNKQLLAHVEPMLYRVKRKIHFKNPMLETIKKDYPIIFHLVALVVSDLQTSMGLVIPDDEIAFLTIHFQVSIEKNHRIKRVLIICLNGVASSQLLALKIRRYLPPLDIMEVSSLEEAKDIDLSRIDFIVSTVKVKIDTVPVFYVSPFISDEDLSQIKNYYSKSLLQSEQKLLSGNSSKSIGRHFLEGALLYETSNFLTKEEVLLFLATETEKHELTIGNTYENLMKREQISSTAFVNGIAVPHPSPKLVKKTQILIIRNTTPIEWGNGKAKLIFLLCMNEKDLHQAKNILTIIIEIANSKQKLSQFMELDSIVNFFQNRRS